MSCAAILASGSSGATVGMQDVCPVVTGGAYTGTVCVGMAGDVGASWVIVGHSERRHVFHESAEHTGGKIAAVLSAPPLGLVYCVGETLEEREGGDPFAVVAAQMESLFAAIPDGQDEVWDRVVVAYEPVWAIGTGKVASADQAQEIHAAIRALIADRVSQAVADKVRIIYGGSVKIGNCVDLIAPADIDGFLIGGASLTSQFIDIINATAEAAGL